MTLTHREKRDYEWAVQSPPLLAADMTGTWPDSSWFSNQVLAPPDAIQSSHDRRLGVRFEKLIQAWIETSDDMTLIAANLQVRNSTRTLGEFDLLVEHEGIVEHWEVAVKFYLNVGGESRLDRWFGPNPTDTLGTKFDRMMNHQLRLGEHEAARLLLQDKNIVLRGRRALMKGRLFYPIDAFEASSFQFPVQVSPDHLRGWWCTPATLGTISMSTEAVGFTRLPKDYWLATVTPDDELTVLGYDELLDDLGDQARWETAHVAIVDITGNELSRGFLVTDRWLRQVPHS